MWSGSQQRAERPARTTCGQCVTLSRFEGEGDIFLHKNPSEEMFISYHSEDFTHSLIMKKMSMFLPVGSVRGQVLAETSLNVGGFFLVSWRRTWGSTW